MKTKILLIAIVIFFINDHTNAQISVCSWNLENFGKSKTDSIISFIASTIKGFDVICILEVVAGDGGAPAVARLSDELNREGNRWNYTISDPTISSSYKPERYAFIWKTSKLKLKGSAWLEKKYSLEIDREPFFANFDSQGKPFTLVAFHAITKSRQPETEIKFFKFLPREYPDKNLIFAGDFNCPESHSVFNPLKTMGYRPVFYPAKDLIKRRMHKG